MTDDLELLWEYARSGSNAAFSTVAARYIDLIYSAALRQVRDPHVAEDVTQAVLILLMNKAASLPAGTIVPGWLVRTTRYAALDAMKLQRRRLKHERQAAQMRTENPLNPSDPDAARWEDVAPLVDEALLKLRPDDRDAVVLRYLLNKTPEEIAWVLRVSEDAARQRVSRALGRLRAILNRGGVSAGESAIGAVLMANAVMRAPTSLSALAGTIAAPASGALSTPPTIIARGTARAMARPRAIWILATGAAGVMIVIMAIVLWPKPNVRSAADVNGPSAEPLQRSDAPPPGSVGLSAPRRPARTPAQIEAQYANKLKTRSRLGWAANAGDFEAVQQFVAAGDDVNEPSHDGQALTPLIEAAMCGRDSGFDAVKFLLDHGADLNARRPGSYGALMAAVRHHSPRTVKLLLDRGADVSFTNPRGESALDWARQENDPEIIRLLESANAQRAAGPHN